MRQGDLLKPFRESFEKRFGANIRWAGGQVAGNFANLPRIPALRRHGKTSRAERFELGDLRAHMCGWTVVVECDAAGASVHNLLKYWPYLRGELDVKPQQTVLLCHFSSWSS